MERKNISTVNQSKPFSFAAIIGRFALYFKVVIQGKKHNDGYKYRDISNRPFVGVHHIVGYEIINPKTNQVLYRKAKDYGIIGNNHNDYHLSKYNVVSKFFPENAL